jgi:ERCC4-type nuclease
MQKQLIKDDLKHTKVVDSREPDTARIQIRTLLLETGWRQEKLQSGDFMFYTCLHHKVGITRKTTDDCMASLNKTFGKQLEEMLELYDICIILIENPWKWIESGQLLSGRGLEKQTKKGILNYIHRWQAKGFVLERTADWKDTVVRLNELYALYQKPYSLSARSRGYADERLLALPSGLRGKVGELLLKDKTLREIANMTSEEILTLGVSNIGEKRARLVFEHFNRRGNNADSPRDS